VNTGDEKPRKRTLIGPWRLLDLALATSAWRGGLMGGAAALPEHGPPDPKAPSIEPDEELPNSYIGDGEQQQAIARERARRFVRAYREQHERA